MHFESDRILEPLVRRCNHSLFGMEGVWRGLRGQSNIAALAFICFMTASGVAAQEVVIFKDHRSEVVASHRVEGSWTFLQVRGGEIAVPSDQILQIRKATEEEMLSNLPAKAPANPPSPSVAKNEDGNPAAETQPKPPKNKLRNLAVSRGKGREGGTKQSEKLESKSPEPSGVKKVY